MDAVDSSRTYTSLKIRKDNAVNANVSTVSSDDTSELTVEQVLPDNVLGWITVDNTHIDYPIVQGNDNLYYQKHDYLGQRNSYGAIFIDNRNTCNLSDPYTIIYGHNSIYNLMFSDLKLLLTTADHPITLSMRNDGFLETSYKVTCIAIVNELSPIYNLIPFDDMCTELEQNAKYYTDIKEGAILLSTCYGKRGTDKRLIVVVNKEDYNDCR